MKNAVKKLHLVFGIAALSVLFVGLLHGGISWLVAELTWEPFATSFPTWAVFVLTLMFYSLGAAAILLLWLIAYLIVCAFKRKRKGDCKRQGTVLSCHL